ncbi:hypothetical protein SISNIDRAFT_496258 [Sistotremastrum niveocremeum HHB9708]|uniref:Uncharacterized protein n=1 Tax=Sistotremastrum niveocremeum HHB9708 TaxID=1314777 RepID=A0A164TD08_9AGAM|nr:hypothetical protein SISNIDRAFT_496258 [Sistotremastrum niveocremeum HHB9708]
MNSSTCPAPLPIPSNVTDLILSAGLNGLQVAFTLSNQTGNDLKFNKTTGTFQSLYCAAASALALNECYGICPNADITATREQESLRIGPARDYLTVSIEALLVLNSPPDSNLASWSATMLTIAIVLPAIYQKSLQALTLYHATQVLNFATFSTVTSLAVAPLCDIWREVKPGKITDQDHPFDGDAGFSDPETRMQELSATKMQTSRALLTASFVVQISLQWTWCILLFTNPKYAQTPCSGSTVVYLFGFPFRACDINNGNYAIYPLWLLFCMSLVLFWGILLVFASSPSFHPVLSPSSTLRQSPETPLQNIIRQIRFLLRDRNRLFVVFTNTLAVFAALLLLCNSEAQAWTRGNLILQGENTTLGFGQMAALLLGITPAAGLIVALHNQSIERAKKRDSAEDGLLKASGVQTPPVDLGSENVHDIESRGHRSPGFSNRSISSTGANALGLQVAPQLVGEEDNAAIRMRPPFPSVQFDDPMHDLPGS